MRGTKMAWEGLAQSSLPSLEVLWLVGEWEELPMLSQTRADQVHCRSQSDAVICYVHTLMHACSLQTAGANAFVAQLGLKSTCSVSNDV